MSDTVVVTDTDNGADATLTASQYSEIMSALGNLSARVSALEVTTTSELTDAAEAVEDIIDDAVQAAIEAEDAAAVAQEAAAISTVAAVESMDAAEDAEDAAEDIAAEEILAPLGDVEPVTLSDERYEDTISPVPTHFMHRPLGRRRR